MAPCILVGGYQNLNHIALNVYYNIFLVKHVILSIIRSLISHTKSLFYKYVFQAVLMVLKYAASIYSVGLHSPIMTDLQDQPPGFNFRQTKFFPFITTPRQNLRPR
jgi:hypothetical protein